MKMIIVIIKDHFRDALTGALTEAHYRVTGIASTGGFMRSGVATLLIALPEGHEEDALKALEKSCRQRVEYLTMPLEGSPLPMPTPIPVTVGGATVFMLPVERFEEL